VRQTRPAAPTYPQPDMMFPPGFLWGAATSAHQVEGGASNDWTDWENTPGRIRDGSNAQMACDHYHRFREDWALARDLGHNAHRLGVEWSRIEQAEGVFSDEALHHYRDVLAALRDAGLQPMVTLHHFTNPRWFVANGGWESRTAVDRFTRYVERTVSALRDLCSLWVTINEPMIYFYEGYLTRRWPPGRGGPVRGLRAVRNMIRAHAQAYHLIHSLQDTAQVGIAHNMRLFDPANPRRLLDRLTAGAEDRVFNRVLLWALADGYLRAPLGAGEYVAEADDSLDFIGLNYYARDMVAFALHGGTAFFARNGPAPGAATDLFGWELYPHGLYRLLMDLAAFGKPLYVTENGLADATDAQRPLYLAQSVAAMWQAVQEGAPLRGYFHWTLLDNFEWAEGYSVPFGLVSVDRQTQQRTVKRSGMLYREICRANGLPASLLREYPVNQEAT